MRRKLNQAKSRSSCSYLTMLFSIAIVIMQPHLLAQATSLGYISSAPICPTNRPQQAPGFSATHPRVWPHLSKLTRKLMSLPGQCQAKLIDHRNELPKSFQLYTSFCHIHAFTELWNSYVPRAFHANAANLALQYWVLAKGGDLDTILDFEVEKIRNLLSQFPPGVLANENMLPKLQGIVQGGWLPFDFELLQKHGYYPRLISPKTSDVDVQRLTDRYNQKHELIFLRSRRGMSDEQIKDVLRPIYQDIMDAAWKSRDQVFEWQALGPMRDFIRQFQLKVVTYVDSPEARKELLDVLKEQPVGISRARHAVVLAGYDEEKGAVWIRDSALVRPYYERDAEIFLSKVNSYQYFQRDFAPDIQPKSDF